MATGELVFLDTEGIVTLDVLDNTSYSTSSKVRIRWTNARYVPLDGDEVDTRVIPSPERKLVLQMGVHLDPSLRGHGYSFLASFRVIQVSTNKVQKNYWRGKVDELNEGDFGMSKFWKRAKDGVPGDRGLYSFEPFLIIDTGYHTGWEKEDTHKGFGTSEFATADPWYFLIETLPEWWKL